MLIKEEVATCSPHTASGTFDSGSTSLTGFPPRDSFGVVVPSLLPPKLSDKGECIISFTSYRRVLGEELGRGEEKVNSILESTKGFRKFRGEIGVLPRS